MPISVYLTAECGLERGPAGLVLVHYRQNGPGSNWGDGHVIEGTTGRVGGIPGFIQSTFGTEFGNPGNFEVVVPAIDGGLLHFFRFPDPTTAWRQAPSIENPSPRMYMIAHLIQSTFGSPPHKNFELVAETGNPDTFGFGQLFFCWCDNAAGVWSSLTSIVPA